MATIWKTELQTLFRPRFRFGANTRSPTNQNDAATVSLMISEEHQNLWSFEIGTSKSEDYHGWRDQRESTTIFSAGLVPLDSTH